MVIVGLVVGVVMIGAVALWMLKELDGSGW